MKKILATLICVAMLVTTILSCMIGTAAEEAPEIIPDTSWYVEDPEVTEFVLEDEEDYLGFIALLAGGKQFFNTTIKLNSDINLNPGYTGDPEEIPTNIYPSTHTGKFYGTFDGQGHYISGVYMIGLGKHAGLLGYGCAGAVAKNFSLINSCFTGEAECNGGVFGSIAKSETDPITIENVYVNINMVSTRLTNGHVGWGGLVGYQNPGELIINNCVVASTISLTGQEVTTDGVTTVQYGTCVGGFVGSSKYVVTVNNSAFYGKIVTEGGQYFGGIAGNTTHTWTINNCVVAADLGNGNYTSAFYGRMKADEGVTPSFTITNSYYANDIERGLPEEHEGWTLPTDTTGVHAIDKTTLQGSAAASVLTACGLTEWTAMEDGYAVPTTVSTLTFAIDPPTQENPGVTTPGDTTPDGGDETEAPETNAPETNAPTTTTAPAEEESGCASVAMGASVMLIVCGAAAVVCKKKKAD